MLGYETPGSQWQMKVYIGIPYKKCNSPGGHGHAGRSIPKKYLHYRFLCNFGFVFRLGTKFRNETIRGQLSDV